MSDNELAAFLALVVSTAVTLSYIARAYMKRLDARDRRSALPSGTDDRLTRIEQAVDSIAIEVERISEAQRFTTRLLADRSAAEPAPRDS